MMCIVCGCGQGEVTNEGHDHADHDHLHPYDPLHNQGHLRPVQARAPSLGIHPWRLVKVEQDLLAKNNAYAAENRHYLTEHGVFALNLVSSPGSGKTTLLIQTVAALQDRVTMAVIEGDQQTSFDADRIRATGVPAIQINTGKGCHLDAHMVGHALEKLPLPEDGVLFIENVGNLVCPSSFDLGEAHKVVILAVTEGEDKPLKYPDMFHAADVMLLNKIDLLPYLSFDVERCIDYARRVNPDIVVMRVSATRGDGMSEWLTWIERGRQAAVRHKAERIAALKARAGGG